MPAPQHLNRTYFDGTLTPKLHLARSLFIESHAHISPVLYQRAEIQRVQAACTLMASPCELCPEHRCLEDRYGQVPVIICTVKASECKNLILIWHADVICMKMAEQKVHIRRLCLWSLPCTIQAGKLTVIEAKPATNRPMFLAAGARNKVQSEGSLCKWDQGDE